MFVVCLGFPLLVKIRKRLISKTLAITEYVKCGRQPWMLPKNRSAIPSVQIYKKISSFSSLGLYSDLFQLRNVPRFQLKRGQWLEISTFRQIAEYTGSESSVCTDWSESDLYWNKRKGEYERKTGWGSGVKMVM